MIFLNDCSAVCSLGNHLEDIRAAIFSQQHPDLVHFDLADLGRVICDLPSMDDVPLPMQSRCNALIRKAMSTLQIPDVQRYAIVIGTSTSGIESGERALIHRRQYGNWPTGYDYEQQNMFSPSRFIQYELGRDAMAYTVSTACSSSARALIAGARILRQNFADVVIAGGADTLTQMTRRGFSALRNLASGRCNPFSKNRQGLHLGEAAALFVMSRQPGPVRLSGWGESLDCHHISAPDPSGEAASLAMAEALRRANRMMQEVDYINLHGTGTVLNDAMEARALARLGAQEVLVSSTKTLTGHTLGAAGALEASVAWLSIVDNPRGYVPTHWWDGIVDPELPVLRFALEKECLGHRVQRVLSPSFAFGGSNTALLLECA